MKQTFESRAAGVTSAAKFEDELRARVEQLEMVLRATNEGLWDWNLVSGEVYFSPRWKAMLGFSDDEFPDSTTEWERRVHPDDLDEAVQAIRSHLAGELETCENEHRLRHKDGSYRWIYMRSVVNRDSDGQPMRMVGSHADITDRKRAEEQSIWLAAIVESSNDAIIGMLRDGTITSWNAAAERLLGRPASEVLGTSIRPLLPPDELTRLRDVLTKLTNGEPVDQFETKLNKQDGTGVAVSVTFSLVRNGVGDVTGASVIARDITDRKRAEEELARRDAILEAIRFATQRFLRRTVSWDENIGELLARFGRATGVSRVYIFETYTDEYDETRHHHCFEWTAPNITPLIDDPLLTALSFREQGWERWEEILRQANPIVGRTRDFPVIEQTELEREETLSLLVVPIFVDDQMWGFIGFDDCIQERMWSSVEIEALKAAADTLGGAIQRDRAEEQLAWLAAIVESSDDAIIGRTLDNRIISWNEGAERLYGYRADEVLGKNVSMLMVPNHASSQMTDIFAAIARGEQVHHYEGERRRKDGSHIWVSISFSPVRNHKGEVIGSAATTRDITEQKRAEADLRESQRSLSTLMANLPGMAYRHHATPDWGMEFVSEGAFDLTGYAPHDLMGGGQVAYNDLVHPDDRADVLAGIRSAVDRDEPFRVTYRITPANGVEKWVLEQGRAVWDDGNRLVAIEGIITDVTDRVLARQQLEQAVAERTRELATLLNVSTRITSTLELRPLLGAILDQFGQVVQHVAAAVYLLDDDTNLVLLDYRGPVAREDLSTVWPLQQGHHSREVVTTRKPVIIPDVRAETPLAASFRHQTIHDLGEVPVYAGSWMGVPLIYREHVIGLLTVVGADVDAYTSRDADITFAFASQAAVAIANARLYEQAQGKAALEERQRLARELHDSVSQALFGIGLGARTALALLDQDPTRAAEPLDYVLSLADAGLTEMRALIFELRPEALEQEGLVAALEKQVATLRARHGLDVTVEIDEGTRAGLPVEEAVYRIAQEALHNIVKHARATTVRVRLSHEPGRIILSIRDDGVGFDPLAAFTGHLGLTSMRERAERLGGSLGIESAPGCGGSRLHVEIPA